MLEQAIGWGKKDTVRGVNAEGGGDATEEEGLKCVRPEEGPKGDVICTKKGPGEDQMEEGLEGMP